MARMKKRAVKRPLVLAITSILFLIGGVVSLISLLILMFSGSSLVSLFQNPDIAKEEIVIATTFLLYFLIISLIVAILDIIAGIGLWKARKYSGIIGLISSIISILMAVFLIQVDFGFSLLYNLLEIVLLVKSWKYLS